MYVIETRTGLLHQVTGAEAWDVEAKAAQAGEPSPYTAVSAARAHHHVKRGGLHSTPLYIDATGRIRYASNGQ